MVALTMVIIVKKNILKVAKLDELGQEREGSEF